MIECTGCGRDLPHNSINGDRSFHVSFSGKRPILDIDVKLCPGCYLILADAIDPRKWRKRIPQEEFCAGMSQSNSDGY